MHTGGRREAPHPCVEAARSAAFFMDGCVAVAVAEAEAVAVAVAEAVAVAVTEAVTEADQSIHDQSIQHISTAQHVWTVFLTAFLTAFSDRVTALMRSKTTLFGNAIDRDRVTALPVVLDPELPRPQIS